jgi:hypothetical protein
MLSLLFIIKMPLSLIGIVLSVLAQVSMHSLYYAIVATRGYGSEPK